MKRSLTCAVSLLVTAVLLLSSCNNISVIVPSSTVPVTELTTDNDVVTDKEDPAITTYNGTVTTEEPAVDPKPREIKKTAVSDGIWTLDISFESTAQDMLVIGDRLVVLYTDLENERDELTVYDLVSGEIVGSYDGFDNLHEGSLLKLDDKDSFAVYYYTGVLLRFESPENLEPSLVADAFAVSLTDPYSPELTYFPDGSCIIMDVMMNEDELIYCETPDLIERIKIKKAADGYLDYLGRKGNTVYINNYDWENNGNILLSVDIQSKETKVVKECTNTSEIKIVGNTLLEKTNDGRIMLSSLDNLYVSTVFSLESNSEYVRFADEDYIITCLIAEDERCIGIYECGGELIYFGAPLKFNGFISHAARMPEGILLTFVNYNDDWSTSEQILYLIEASELPDTERGKFGRLAKELEEKIENEFDMTLNTGLEAIIDFPDFEAKPLKDDYSVYIAEKTVYETLKEFPEGFISELFHDTGKGNCTEFVMCLTGKLTPTNEYSTSNPIAYAYYTDTTQYIVVDIQTNYGTKTNVAHELMHAIDRYLEAVNDYNTYPDWYSYLPRRYDYNWSYVSRAGEDYDDPKYTEMGDEPVYFIDSYSKTFPTEDRARLFENMFTANEYSSFLEYPYITARMAYLANYIRANFESVRNSSEPPVWEKYIGEALEDAA